MDSEIGAIVISLITGILTFASAIYATTLQNRRNKEEADQERREAVARSRLDQDKLEQQLEESLWVRVRDEIARLDKQLSRERDRRIELEQQLSEERLRRRDLETRLAKLISENAKLTGMVEAMRHDNSKLESENNALRDRVRELERRMGTGPLEK